jgi:hypothetical protein
VFTEDLDPDVLRSVFEVLTDQGMQQLLEKAATVGFTSMAMTMAMTMTMALWCVVSFLFSFFRSCFCVPCSVVSTDC